MKDNVKSWLWTLWATFGLWFPLAFFGALNLLQ